MSIVSILFKMEVVPAKITGDYLFVKLLELNVMLLFYCDLCEAFMEI